MSDNTGKVGRPKSKDGKVGLHVRISGAVKRAFARHIGPGRVLAHAVEQALRNEMRRGSVKEVA